MCVGWGGGGHGEGQREREREGGGRGGVRGRDEKQATGGEKRESEGYAGRRMREMDSRG